MSYSPTRNYGPPSAWDALVVSLFVFVAALALSSCATTRDLPPPSPPAVAVYVPVTEACEIEKVENTPLHTDDGAPDDIYEATKQLLADLGLLKGDRERLQAANSGPCPEVQP